MSGFDYFKDVVFNKYAKFDGRARRAEYWYFTLFHVLIAYGLIGVAFLFLFLEIPSVAMAVLGVAILFSLAMLVPTIAVAVRRLQDFDKSGWYLLLTLLPLLGILILYFLVMPGTEGPNQFGPDPKGRGGDTIIDNFV